MPNHARTSAALNRLAEVLSRPEGPSEVELEAIKLGLAAAKADRLEASAAEQRLRRNKRRPHVMGAVPALAP
jgi:hypothetical protein